MSERGILDDLRWAMIFVAGALLSCTWEERPEWPAPSNLLLITVDTLRADHLSSYGYPRRTSPVIDELAAEGVRFDQAVVQWPKTGPSFASIFTATYPKDNHIVRRVGVPLPPSFRTVAEVLRRQGYSTHAVVANGALASELRYDQGFDTYVETWKRPGAGPDGRYNPAARVTDLAREAAKAIDGERPFFFWVHYIDPHFPYAPPEPWRDLFQDDEHVDGDREIWVHPWRRRLKVRGIGREQVIEGRRDLDFYVARYDAEIAYADSQIGELWDFLDEEGLLEDTLTVVTSDHGESLGEHKYYFSHGLLGFQPGLRVPLIFHAPDVLAPKVDPDPVELIHLAPTLLEVAGVPLEEGEWMQGRSLVPRLLGAAPAEDTPYAYSEAGQAVHRKWQRIVRDGRFKLIYAQAGAENRWLASDGRPMALYDLDADPGETVDVADRYPRDFRRLREALDAWWDQEPFAVHQDAPREDGEGDMDEATRRQLEALGYL